MTGAVTIGNKYICMFFPLVPEVQKRLTVHVSQWMLSVTIIRGYLQSSGNIAGETAVFLELLTEYRIGIAFEHCF
jgi:hypothetical protein